MNLDTLKINTTFEDKFGTLNSKDEVCVLPFAASNTSDTIFISASAVSLSGAMSVRFRVRFLQPRVSGSLSLSLAAPEGNNGSLESILR